MEERMVTFSFLIVSERAETDLPSRRAATEDSTCEANHLIKISVIEKYANNYIRCPKLGKILGKVLENVPNNRGRCPTAKSI